MNIKDLFLTGQETVVTAMSRIDAAGGRVVFITEEDKLKGVVSEGDVRRFILSGGDISSPVSEIACYTPIYLTADSKRTALQIMKEKNIEGIPVVDNEGRIIKAYFWNEEFTDSDDTTLEGVPVVMMAGGKGTRLYPYTKILPKPLIPVGEKPIAEIIMDRFYECGCKDFYLIVNHKKNMIKSYFNETEVPYTVNYADEDKPLGTGGGLKLLSGVVKDTFILTNCDIIIDDDYRKIYRHHKESGNAVTMIVSLRNYQVPYGVVEIGENGEISAMKEKPEFSYFTNTGTYIVEPSVIDEIKDDEPIGFPDIIERIRAKGEKVGVYPISESAWMDMGQLDELSKMEISLAK